MPEYLAPGVYVEEVELGPRPIEGVSTSTTGFVGMAVRGPVNRPTLVTSMGEYERIFGGYLGTGYGDRRWLPFAVEAFFANGGRRAFIVRAANWTGLPADTNPDTFARVATAGLPDRADARRTLNRPARAGDTELDLAHWTGIATGDVLRVGEGAGAEYVTVTEFRNRVVVAPALTGNHAAGVNVVATSARTELAGPTANAAGSSRIWLESDSGVGNGGWVMLGEGAQAEPSRLAAAGTAGSVAVTSPLLASHAAGTPVRAVAIGEDGTGAPGTPLLAGAEVIRLDAAAVAEVSQGDWIWIQGNGASAGTQGELVRITGPVAVDTDIPVSPALRFPHNADREVQLATLGADPVTTLGAPRGFTVASAAGIQVGDLLMLRDGASTEFLQVAAVAGASVTASSTLRFPHGNAVEVRRLESTAAATVLAAPSDRDAAALQVGDRGDLVPGAVIEILDDGQTEYAEVVASGAGAGEVTLIRPLRYPHAAGTPVRVLQLAMRITAGRWRPAPNLNPEPGSWGNDIRVAVEPVGVLRTDVDAPAAAGATLLQLRSAHGIETGTVLRLPGNRYARVNLVEGNRVFLSAPLAAAVTQADLDAAAEPWRRQVHTVEFKMTFTYGGTTEAFEPLSMDPRHPRYFVTVINRDSRLVHVADADPEEAPDPAGEMPLVAGEWRLGGGSDGTAGITPDVYAGRDHDDADRRTGLFAMLNAADVSIVAVPGQTSTVVQQALIAHAERARYRFAVLDSGHPTDLERVQEQRSLYDTKYGALYYPWVQVLDPTTRRPTFAPPSGHVAGIYARTDTEVGVHRAPANAVVRQVDDLAATVTTGQQEILNPRGINAIRAFPGRGIRVWGARTLSSDALWRYINVRRLFIYLERSIDESTQYAVFEPNDRPLWSRLRASLTAFLTTTWRNGALQGATAEEAFFVRVGLGETMTQDDIDAGRVIILVGVAPVKPAEFVIFRIGQKAGGSDVSE